MARVFLRHELQTDFSLVAQTVKRLPTMRETRVRSLGREDPLEKEMAILSSTTAWKNGKESCGTYTQWSITQPLKKIHLNQF